MKKLAVLAVSGAVIFCVVIVASTPYAKEKKGAKRQEAKQVQAVQVQQPNPQDVAAQEKQILLANINNISSQQMRFMVLQQLLNEEVAKLRNLEAVFCDQYKLDIEKFRKGGYRYDDKQGKVVEIK